MALPHSTARRWLTSDSELPGDESLGHSFCYVRPNLPLGRSGSSKVHHSGETTTFRSISGAAVSANPSTPLSTSRLLLPSELTCSSASSFESSAYFSSIPLQPVPRFSGSLSGPLAADCGFMSGPLTAERGFMSGPLATDHGFIFRVPSPPTVDLCPVHSPPNGASCPGLSPLTTASFFGSPRRPRRRWHLLRSPRSPLLPFRLLLRPLPP